VKGIGSSVDEDPGGEGGGNLFTGLDVRPPRGVEIRHKEGSHILRHHGWAD